jgi:hypothetical protein
MNECLEKVWRKEEGKVVNTRPKEGVVEARRESERKGGRDPTTS